jgi:mediator of RNA polymerase II transcription subunit 6
MGMDCRKRTGIEYILQEAQEPNHFVIRKQKREGPEKVTALAAYYVLDGSIYQAPQLYTVIGSRVVGLPSISPSS